MKKLFWLSLLSLLLPNANAQAAAPSMMGVKEVILQNARIGDALTASACGLSRTELTKAIVMAMKTSNAPITPVTEAAPPTIGVARIDLVPEVISLNTQNVDCTSWVSLSAQTQNVLTIPPIDTPRNVIVTYWRSGLIVSSAKTTHGQVLNDTVGNLAQAFARQYLVDQPPPLPTIDE